MAGYFVRLYEPEAGKFVVETHGCFENMQTIVASYTAARGARPLRLACGCCKGYPWRVSKRLLAKRQDVCVCEMHADPSRGVYAGLCAYHRMRARLEERGLL